MAAGNTYEAIATQTLGSAAASVTFSSIPSTYTDLVLISTAGVTSGLLNYAVRFNSDSGANYSRTVLSGTGVGTATDRNTNITYNILNDYGYLDTTLNTNILAHIMNYSNATTFKTTLSRTNNTANGTSTCVNLWRSTAAINSLLILPTGSTFLAGSTFSLYGIASA
jgi:hypothetical protein